MNTYHVTLIGYDTAAVKLVRRVEADSDRQAAQLAYWLAETRGIGVNSVMVAAETERDGHPVRLPVKVFHRDDLRAPFYGCDIVRPSAVASARHLPEDERNELTRRIGVGDMPGMVGGGRVAIDVAEVDPIAIEDDLPVLSSLVQIARDEGVALLVFDVRGRYLATADLYPE